MLLERGSSSLFDILRERRSSTAFAFEEKISIALQLSLGLQVHSRLRCCCGQLLTNCCFICI
jgi:hypothetical protein